MRWDVWDFVFMLFILVALSTFLVYFGTLSY